MTERDTIPAPPVPSSPPNAERDQLERKNRLLHGQIAKLEGRLAMLEAEYRLLLGACYEAAQALRSALDDNGGPFIPE